LTLRRFRGTADMERFSARNDLSRMTRTGHEWSLFAAMHVGFFARWCDNMRP
jgi:hypothetical protein